MAFRDSPARLEADLAANGARLAVDGANTALLAARADLLARLGRGEEATAAYLELLRVAPGHLAGLNNFGALVHGQGYASAARTLYREAVRHHPHDPMSNVNLGNSLLEIGENQAASAAFHRALTRAPAYPPAHRGLARLACERGDLAQTTRHLRAAFGRNPLIEPPYRGGRLIEVLLLISGVQADIPLRPALDPGVFAVSALAVEFFDPAKPLPPHDVLFNTIGDADLRPEALEAAARLPAAVQTTMLNRPERVAKTGRVANAARLGALPGVVTAASVLVDRRTLAHADAARIAALGLRFPIAVRAPGYHTGQHFERVETEAQLGPALADLPGESVIAMNFLDTRGPDGLYRKYRVMFINGEMFPLHLAVSDSWKVHYFSADMADAPERRAQDAAFLADMPAVLGDAAMQALARVRDTLGLDYAGVDFTLAADGALVVFEANATMVVHPSTDDPIWRYRQAPTRIILEAVKAMIVSRAQSVEHGRPLASSLRPDP